MARDPAAPVIRVIRVAPGDMTRVVATAADTAATGRAGMTPADTADTIQVDPGTRGDTIPASPVVTTRVGPADMIRERPGAQSRGDPASLGDTIPEDRALLDRRPVRRDRMLELPRRVRVRLHPRPAEHPMPADQQAAAIRPVDRTLRREATPPVGATPKRT